MNVGATSETDYGSYFMWGSTRPNTANECNWTNAPFNNSLSSFNSTYFSEVKDTVCPNDILAKGYDAASQIMGGDWRMPTKAELQELIDYTTNEWVEGYNGTGVRGTKFTGSNGNSIFIPAAGEYSHGEVYDAGIDGYVLSSSLDTSKPDYAWNLRFNSAGSSMVDGWRLCGLPVRGVCK